MKFILLIAIVFSAQARASSCHEEVRKEVLNGMIQKLGPGMTAERFEEYLKKNPEGPVVWEQDKLVHVCEIKNFSLTFKSERFTSLCKGIQPSSKYQCLREWIKNYPFTWTNEVSMVAEHFFTEASLADLKKAGANRAIVGAENMDAIILLLERIDFERFYASRLKIKKATLEPQAQELKRAERELLAGIQSQLIASVEESLVGIKKYMNKPEMDAKVKQRLQTTLPNIERRLKVIKTKKY